MRTKLYFCVGESKTCVYNFFYNIILPKKYCSLCFLDSGKEKDFETHVRQYGMKLNWLEDFHFLFEIHDIHFHINTSPDALGLPTGSMFHIINQESKNSSYSQY